MTNISMSPQRTEHKIRAFLICPVRGVFPEHTRSIVEKLESEGVIVHWPHRDTDQNVESLAICAQNREAIRNADVVYVVWDGKSQGCLFDLGMAFTMNKKIIALQIPDATEEKSFQNLMIDLDHRRAGPQENSRKI